MEIAPAGKIYGVWIGHCSVLKTQACPVNFMERHCYLTLIVSCTGSRLTYEKTLGVSVGLFLDCVSPGGRETHTKCIQHHSMDSDP